MTTARVNRRQQFGAAMVDQTMQARAVTVATGAGLLIRYGFYFVGLFVFAAIAVGIIGAYNYWPRQVAAPTAFHIASPDLNALTATSDIITGGSIGRSEVRQYGQLYHHGRDMTVVLTMPPAGQPMARDFGHEIASFAILRKARARVNAPFYDLQTRFGPLRAAEMYVDVDGRRKLCLAFLSRFDTPYVYLKGWTCEASGMRPSPDGLACTLNRLTLDQPLANPQADAFVRAGFTRGAGCYATPVTQTTDTRPNRRPPRRY